jgi:hypothetical protein
MSTQTDKTSQIAQVLDSVTANTEATKLVQIVAKQQPDLSLHTISLPGTELDFYVEQQLKKVVAAAKTVLKLGSEDALDNEIIGALLLNATQGALKAALAVAPVKYNPPYLNPDSLPERRLGPELFPANTLAQNQFNYVFNRGNGSLQDPYVWEGSAPDLDRFTEKLRGAALLTNQPFVYGRDSSGVLEVCALVPLNNLNPHAGTSANPYTIPSEFRHYNIQPYYVRELARRIAVASNSKEVFCNAHFQGAPNSVRITPYQGRGDVSYPYEAQPGESPAVVSRNILEILKSEDKLAAWVKADSATFVVHRLKGHGTEQDPFQVKLSGRYSIEDILAAAGQVAQFKQDLVFVKHAGKSHCLLAQNAGVKADNAYYIGENSSLLSNVYRRTQVAGQPTYFMASEFTAVASADNSIFFCIPESELASGFRDELRKELKLGARASKAVVVDCTGKVLEEVFPFEGKGTQECPFEQPVGQDRKKFESDLLQYLMHTRKVSTHANIESEPREVVIGTGEGSINSPIVNDKLVAPSRISCILSIIEEAAQQNPPLLAKDDKGNYTITTRSFSGSGEESSPLQNPKLTPDQLRKQAYEYALFCAKANIWIEVNGEKENIPGLVGAGTAKDPVIIPEGLSEDFFGEEFANRVASSRKLDVAFIRNQSGESRYYVNSEFGRDEKTGKFFCNSLEEAQNIQKIAELTNEVQLAEFRGLTWVCFPKDLAEAEKQDYIQKNFASLPYAYGKGTVEEPITLAGMSPQVFFYGGSDADKQANSSKTAVINYQVNGSSIFYVLSPNSRPSAVEFFDQNKTANAVVHRDPYSPSDRISIRNCTGYGSSASPFVPTDADCYETPGALNAVVRSAAQALNTPLYASFSMVTKLV